MIQSFQNVLRVVLVCGIIASLGGCASTGKRVYHTETGEVLPSVEQILADLDANDSLIDNFRGAGTFVLESPKFDGKRKFRGNLQFQRPHNLYVQGAKLAGAVVVFKMICVEQEFLMEFPGNREDSFYQLDGEEFVDVPFSVSPSDIAKEMFLPEQWGDVKKKSLKVVSYEAVSNTLLVQMMEKRRVRRQLELQQVDAESPRWVITRNIRFDEREQVLAITELTEYSKVDDALFPGEVDAYFPTEDTRMTFSMRNIRLNTEIDASTFDILARARELNLEGRHGEPSAR